MRFALLLVPLFAVTASHLAATPAISAREIPSPTTDQTAGSSRITTSPDGIVWLTWLESVGETIALRFSTFDPTAQRWRPARTIASGADLHAGSSDGPALTAGAGGRATALWYVKNPSSPETAHLHHGAGYHAVTSSTRDGGRTWSPPAKISRESDINEFASIATLADGRVLAVWLDARVKKALGAHAAHASITPAQQLLSRIVGTDAPDTLVDASVCDCCHTSLTTFPDGTALLAYRGRGDEEVRDIRVTRFRDHTWDEPRPLNNDDWRIAGCPVNGPQLASDGGRVAAAWFTAAGNEPRVLASFSPDAGARFLMPLRLSAAKPAGRVSTLLLHDGAMLVSWVDADGALSLRRITPDYAAGATVQLTQSQRGRIKGFPRLALLRDYAGGRTSAQLLATFTREDPAGLHTLLIDVPEGELLEAEKNCDCAPTPAQLNGFPIRGTIVAVEPGEKTVRVKHPEIPGMFAAGVRTFQVAPNVLSAEVQAGRPFIGRFERGDDGNGWRLFDLRLIATPKPSR